MSRLLRLLDQLEQAKISYRLEHVRDSIMIVAAVPGERWEIELLEDGEVEIERFISSGVTDDRDLLGWLLATYGVESSDAAVTPTHGVAPDNRGGNAPPALGAVQAPRR
jgi:hypothetical protein